MNSLDLQLSSSVDVAKHLTVDLPYQPRSSRPAVAAAARTALRSGPPTADKGVGTQMTITSCGPISALLS